MKHIICSFMVVAILLGGAAPYALAQSTTPDRAALQAQIAQLYTLLAGLQAQLEARNSAAYEDQDLTTATLREDVAIVHPTLDDELEFTLIDDGGRQGFDALSWQGKIGDDLVINVDLGSQELLEAFQLGIGMIQLMSVFQLEDSEQSVAVEELASVADYELYRLIISDEGAETGSLIAMRELQHGDDTYGLMIRVTYGTFGDLVRAEMESQGIDARGAHFKDEAAATRFLHAVLHKTVIEPADVAQHINTSSKNMLEQLEEYMGDITDIEPSVVKDSVIRERLERLASELRTVDEDEYRTVCSDRIVADEVADMDLSCRDDRSSFMLFAELSDDDYYCIDSDGYSSRVKDRPRSSAHTCE